MQKPIALDNERLWIDAANTAAILPISEEKRLSQGWDSRFKSQVINLGSEGGLDTRSVKELLKEFAAAGMQLRYIEETEEAVNPAMISSVRAFIGKPDAPVQYFHAAARLVNGDTAKEQWFAATPKQLLAAKSGSSPSVT